jgi:hypothetical protein
MALLVCFVRRSLDSHCHCNRGILPGSRSANPPTRTYLWRSIFCCGLRSDSLVFDPSSRVRGGCCKSKTKSRAKGRDHTTRKLSSIRNPLLKVRTPGDAVPTGKNHMYDKCVYRDLARCPVRWHSSENHKCENCFEWASTLFNFQA